ncbi:MAG: TIGR03960 family B12-binding radical SAM protein [Oscillospiraceae bacterium]|nr:TIGR03960 family B12-binding radical SAM protein [Oscillospiraceae bacterium]
MPVDIEKHLINVQKPGRYCGGELNSCQPPAPGGEFMANTKARPRDMPVRYAFCFPDTYEIGMSYLGLQIIYSLLNSLPGVCCERAFAPWGDMREVLINHHLPLFALESRDPLADFDFLGFTLQYELSYTNVLDMLSLAGIPLYSRERNGSHPIIMGGGPCACNAEPLADFFDLFVLGEAEEVLPELMALYKAHPNREEFLECSSFLRGVYVPKFYDVLYNPDGTVKKIVNQQGAPIPVKKRVVRNFNSVTTPEKPLVPLIEVVHDRISQEIFRGCARSCRFCQAGYICRPVREKTPETVLSQIKNAVSLTGHEEVSLASLSTSDYSGLCELLPPLFDYAKQARVRLSLPSLRIDNFPAQLMELGNSFKKNGLTFAPEAGTQRLRNAINKNLTEDDILSACRRAFSGGYCAVKLYFMMGLPTETDEDILGIAALAKRIVDEFYRLPDKPKGKGVSVSVSVACFVPKPHTPFQWRGQDTPGRLREKQQLLINAVTSRKITLHWHNASTSFLEAVFARGDRRLSKVLEEAHRRGCIFDGWSEFFSFERWMATFEACGADPAFYASRVRAYDEVLPWSHLDYGVTPVHLIREDRQAENSTTTTDCRSGCAGCGIAAEFGPCEPQEG